MSVPPSTPATDPVEPVGEGAAARAPRTNLFLGALLALPGQPPRDVRIRNLSAAGARLDLAGPPARGSMLLLCRGSAEVAGQVIWAGEASCGLRFNEPIDVARWMSDRPGPAVSSAASEPTLAEDLALVRRLAARLEDGLAEQPKLIAALGAELQTLDLIGQMLNAAERRANGKPAPEMRGARQAALTLLRHPNSGDRS